MNTLAREVAEAIHAGATSGSAVWDELGGPDAQLSEIHPGKYVITIPQDYDETGEETPHVVVITVECGAPGKASHEPR